MDKFDKVAKAFMTSPNFKTWFYVLSYTWGLPLTLFGLIVTSALRVVGVKPDKFGFVEYFKVGNGWGGLELGPTFLTSKDTSISTCCHEFGHGIQNCIYGVFMPFVVCIPSAVRYWTRKVQYTDKGLVPPDDYDDAWYEGQATKWGTEYYYKMTDRRAASPVEETLGET